MKNLEDTAGEKKMMGEMEGKYQKEKGGGHSIKKYVEKLHKSRGKWWGKWREDR